MAQYSPIRSTLELAKDKPNEPTLGNRPASTSGFQNLLSEDVEIVGTLTFADNLIIEGKVLGDVISKGDLTLGERAFIKGNIQARSAAIHGRVEGNITVNQKCEAMSTANIMGDITAATFAIREGATFMGRSRIGKLAAAPTAGAPANAPKR